MLGSVRRAHPFKSGACTSRFRISLKGPTFMSFYSRICLCLVLLFMAIVAQAEQALAPIPKTGASYPDSNEGLQQQLHDTIEAVKSKDTAKEAALIRALIMPEDATWFTDEFGPAFGPRLAAAYQKSGATLQRVIQDAYEGNAERDWSQPKIFRYSDPATVDSPTDNFLNCMDVIVPLYQTAFNGKFTAYQLVPKADEPGKSKIASGDLPGYYVYLKGGFRYLPQQMFFMLPDERPIRIQLDMKIMRSKIRDYDQIASETFKKLMNLRNAGKPTIGKVVIHFVVGTDGKIKEMNAIEGTPDLRDLFLEEVKQWTFEPTRLDGDPVEVEVNLETGVKANGHY